MPTSIDVRIDNAKAKLETIDRIMVEEKNKNYTQRRNKLIRFLYLEKNVYSRTLAELERISNIHKKKSAEDLLQVSYRHQSIPSGGTRENIDEGTLAAKRHYRIVTWGGIGDALTLTPALRALKLRYPTRKIHVLCTQKSHKEVLKNNPYIDSLIHVGDWGKNVIQLLHRFKIIRFQWANTGILDEVRLFIGVNNGRVGYQWANTEILGPDLFYKKSVAMIMGEKLGVQVDNPRPDCFLSAKEEAEAKKIVSRYPNPVAIQITPESSQNKSWPVENWERLVLNNPQYNFLQIGLADEDVIRGAIDLRRKLTLRQSFGVIKTARAFVGVDSSLAHIAAATHTPAIVLFGPSTPMVWGYAENYNIYKAPRCSPCADILGNDPCPYEKLCMFKITVSDVDRALSLCLANAVNRES
jgi:ADP-heptose:LPS heptosyltransferase